MELSELIEWMCKRDSQITSYENKNKDNVFLFQVMFNGKKISKHFILKNNDPSMICAYEMSVIMNEIDSEIKQDKE